MSTKDDISVDDEDFDAFLRHEGELAQLLKKLPQAMPSADLDAVILAAAKAELERNPAPQSVAQFPATTAANDAGPTAARPTSGFIRRWRVPLGLAASLLVTVQLARWQMIAEQTAPDAPAMLYEKAPAAAPPPPELAPPALMPPAKMVGEARAPAAKFMEEEKKKLPLSPSKPELELQRSNSPNRVANAPANVAADLAPPPVPLQEPAADSYSARAPAPMIAPAPMAAPQQYARTVAPISAPAPAKIAVAPAARPAPAMPEAPVQRVEVTGSTIHRANVESASPVQVIVAEDLKKSEATSVADVVANPADAWLSKIDALLKAGSNQEALQEWHKFRKEYPDYVVPAGISEKIKALDK